MSRTDAHAPTWVRMSRGELRARAWHRCTDGDCDLPTLASAGVDGSRCWWVSDDPGRQVCWCRLCYQPERRRRDARRERRQSRRRVAATVGRWAARHREDE